MESIIVGVDGSPDAQHAVQVATKIARATRAPLRLVYALMPPVVPMDASGYTSSRLWTEQQHWAEQMLAGQKAKVPGDVVVTTLLSIGYPAETIREAAKAARASLIVVGTTGAGATARLFLGSTAHKVVHTALVATLVVRPDSSETLEKFFVAVDGSPHALRAARTAAGMAANMGGSVTLTHVSSPNLIPDIPAYHQLLLDMEAEEVRRVEGLFTGVIAELTSFQVPVATKRLVDGAEAFIEFAEQSGADCLVVGSRGRNAFARVMLGSFADRTLNASKRNVLITR